MEEGEGTDVLPLLFQPTTPLRKQAGQGFQGFEVTILQRCIGEGPKAFGGLQLRGIGRQEDELHARWALQLRGGMPPRTIQDQDDLPRLASLCVVGKAVQHSLEGRRVDRRQ